MLYGNESISTYTRSNVLVWMAMAFQAGVLNIGGYLACHHFVSHVTGFATLFGSEVARGDSARTAGLLAVPGFFLVGSMVSGWLVDMRLKLKKKPKYYVVFGVMLFLIATVVVCGFNGVFGEFGNPTTVGRDYFLMAMLCLICGMQNGTVTSVSRAVVRTTHLTGILTDLGIGIVRMLNGKRIEGGAREDVKANGMRIALISSFIFGSMAGGFLFPAVGFRGFLLPTFVTGGLFGVTLYFQVFKRSSP